MAAHGIAQGLHRTAVRLLPNTVSATSLMFDESLWASREAVAPVRGSVSFSPELSTF